VFAVEFSARSARDLVNMAKKRTNVVPLVADARKPLGTKSNFRIQNVDAYGRRCLRRCRST
jgi:fibrillarin-like rRNA methylase